MATKTITNPQDYNIAAILQGLGVDPLTGGAYMAGDVLTVPGVAQADLDAAFANFDVIEYQRETARGRLKKIKDEKEAAGILWTRADGTVYAIATDAESQAKLTVERAAAKDGLRIEGEDVWKCAVAATGQIVHEKFTNAEIIDIANKARAYVSACFKREGALRTDIDAAANPTTVDLAAGWPSRNV